MATPVCLRSKGARPQSSTDDRLVSADGGLDQRTLAEKALSDEPLPLFAAAAELEMAAIAEQQDPEVPLRQMTEEHNVNEDYSHSGTCVAH